MWGRARGYEKLVTSEVTQEDYEWLFKVPISRAKVVKRRRAIYRERGPISFLYFLSNNVLRAISTGGVEEYPIARVSALVVQEMELASKSAGSLGRRVRGEVRREYWFLWRFSLTSSAATLFLLLLLWIAMLLAYEVSKWRHHGTAGQWDDITTFWPLNGHWLPWL